MYEIFEIYSFARQLYKYLLCVDDYVVETCRH